MTRLVAVTSIASLVVAIGVGAALSQVGGTQASLPHPLVTKAKYEGWQKELPTGDVGGRTMNWEH